MAQSLYPSNLWLPSENDKKISSLNFPTEFPYESDSFGSNSDLNSPVESVVSSTDSSEGSSEDDEFFVGLAQQFAWTSLRETDECFNPNKSEVVKTGSPQSTLSGMDSWFGYGNSSFKSTPMAAREDFGLKKNSPVFRGFMDARSSIPVKSIHDLDYELFSNQICAKNLAYSAEVQQMRRDLVLQALYASTLGRQSNVRFPAQPHRKPEIQNREINFGRHGVCRGGMYHPPPRNHPNPPISTAVGRIHPGGSAVKRASSGTGVFLPRQHFNSQKQGNPAIRFPEPMKTPNQAPIIDFITYRRNNPFQSIQKGFQAEGAINQELHQLPQEWTY